MDGTLEVKDAHIEGYRTYLLPGRHRPPSQGGITEELYSHVLTINGEDYSFLAYGSAHWVFKRPKDRVSFRYVMKGKYKNILIGTIVTVDGTGQPVTRGRRDLNRTTTIAPDEP